MASLLLSVSCGDSWFDQEFKDAAAKQEALDNLTMELFARDPIVDSSNINLDFTANLDAVPRTTLRLPPIDDVYEPISGSLVVVRESKANDYAPSFFYWAGKRVPSRSKDFKAFMAYHHASQAIQYFKDLFPREDLKRFNLQPLTVYYAENGNPFGAHYVPGDSIIYFYETQVGPTVHLNFASSGEAISHEVAHSIQHVMNESVLRQGAGKHNSALLEGLADFFSAAVYRASNILPFVTRAFFQIDSIGEDLGPDPKRDLDHGLFFPDAFFGSPHMDGRVVSGALSDFQKYLNGQEITLKSGCSGNACKRKLPGAPTNLAESYSRVTTLSLVALKALGNNRNQTIHEYAETLLLQCGSNSAVSGWCNSVRPIFSEILTGRGLRFASLVTQTPIASTTDAAADLLIGTTLGMRGVIDSTGALSNGNTVPDPCELISFFPNVSNNSTGAKAGPYLVEARLKRVAELLPLIRVESFDGQIISATQFSVLVEPNIDLAWKRIATLNPPTTGRPNENTAALLADRRSRLFQPYHGAFFIKDLTQQMIEADLERLVGQGQNIENILNPVGQWYAMVSNRSNINISATFDFRFTPLNARTENLASVDPEGRAIVVENITQTLRVSEVATICEGQ